MSAVRKDQTEVSSGWGREQPPNGWMNLRKRWIVSYRLHCRQMSSGSTCGRCRSTPLTIKTRRDGALRYSFSMRHEIIASQVIVGFQAESIWLNANKGKKNSTRGSAAIYREAERRPQQWRRLQPSFRCNSRLQDSYTTHYLSLQCHLIKRENTK